MMRRGQTHLAAVDLAGGWVCHLGIMIADEYEVALTSRRPLKRMSSPERWEAKQLIASGVLDVRDHPMFDEDGGGMMYQEEGAEQELEIELNEDEPAFFQGRTEQVLD
jgi:ATP-dependent RNA helicase DHX8/PRP22